MKLVEYSRAPRLDRGRGQTNIDRTPMTDMTTESLKKDPRQEWMRFQIACHQSDGVIARAANWYVRAMRPSCKQPV